MALTRIPIQPAVIKWARETAGLDVSTAAKRLGVKAERLAAWEEGSLAPTINQIRAMSDVYVRPLAALFMDQPIEDEPARDLPDFRRREIRASIASRALQKAIMRAHRQRDALRDVAEDLELPDAEVHPQFAFDPRLSPNALGEQLRATLRLDAIPTSVLLRPDVLLRELVRRAEALNVTVIQVQRVDVSEMRGFSLGDGPCPIVALNGADWPRGKVYTLLHELAHVGLRSNGLCDLQRTGDTADLERQCDAAAAIALMPRTAFLDALRQVRPGEITQELARAIGNEFGASGEAALLRMIELDHASWDDYWRLKPAFEQAYAAFKAEERHRNAGKDSPIYYQVKTRDLGRRFIRQMLNAHREDVLSSRDLAQLLEVSYDKVPKLIGSAGEDVA